MGIGSETFAARYNSFIFLGERSAMDESNPKRRFASFHLSTLLIWMVFMAMALGINTITLPGIDEDAPAYALGIPLQYFEERTYKGIVQATWHWRCFFWDILLWLSASIILATCWEFRLRNGPIGNWVKFLFRD